MYAAFETEKKVRYCNICATHLFVPEWREGGSDNRKPETILATVNTQSCYVAPDANWFM